MEKIAKRIGKKDFTAVNGIVSRKASQLGISAEAALVILAKAHGIGTSTYQRSLDDTKKTEVREALPNLFTAPSRNNAARTKDSGPAKSVANSKSSLRLAIEYLIQDQELRERCQHDLLSPRHFDKPINQATLVLEDRIRKKAQPAQRLVGENLVNYAFNENLAKTVLRVASNDPDDQRGLTQILRGFVPAFRNKTHHYVVNNLSREEAMCVCGFIDVLLRVVDSSIKAGQQP